MEDTVTPAALFFCWANMISQEPESECLSTYKVTVPY